MQARAGSPSCGVLDALGPPCLTVNVKHLEHVKRFLPAQFSGEFESAEVELMPWQGSGDIATISRSNCFLVIPPDMERIEAGEWVPVLLR